MKGMLFSIILLIVHTTLYSSLIWTDQLNEEHLNVTFIPQKIYYDTFLRQHALTHQPHFQPFENTFAKQQPKLNHHMENGNFTVSKDFSDHWGIYAEASGKKKYRVSSYNVTSGIQFAW